MKIDEETREWIMGYVQDHGPQKLAKEMGVSESTISEWVNTNRGIRPNNMERLREIKKLSSDNHISGNVSHSFNINIKEHDLKVIYDFATRVERQILLNPDIPGSIKDTFCKIIDNTKQEFTK